MPHHTEGQPAMTGQQTGMQGQGYPVDNLTYDLISVLHAKLEGLETYKKYMQDAQGDQDCQQLFQKLYQQDNQIATEIMQHLQKHLTKRGAH
jgi:hypothetical protein